MSEYIEFTTEVDIQPRINELVNRINRYVDEATLAKCERQLEEYGYVKVTRCLDCRNRAGENEHGVDPYFCIYHRMHAQPNFFCAWGEQKGESE